jgi:hypothetical protein
VSHIIGRALPSGVRALGLVIAVLFLLGVACREPAFVELDEAQRLAADLRVQYSVAEAAADRAVMADTDEESIRFARSSEQTSQIIEKDTAALTSVLGNLAFRTNFERSSSSRRATRNTAN